MKMGMSRTDNENGTRWFYICHESKKRGYYSICIGWDGLSRHWFFDLNEVDLFLITKKAITFNWRYFISFSWLRGN